MWHIGLFNSANVLLSIKVFFTLFPTWEKFILEVWLSPKLFGYEFFKINTTIIGAILAGGNAIKKTRR